MSPTWAVSVAGKADHAMSMCTATVRSSTIVIDVTGPNAVPVRAEALTASRSFFTAAASSFSPSWKVTPERTLMSHSV